jgi:hypothetical protein
VPPFALLATSISRTDGWGLAGDRKDAEALDTQAGQTKGEGNLAFGAKWYALSAQGRAVVKASTTPTTTGTTTTTCPYPPC